MPAYARACLSMGLILASLGLAAALPGSLPVLAQPPAPGGSLALVSDEGGSPQLVLMDASGADRTVLGPAPLTGERASWSPDGTRLAYISEVQPGQAELMIAQPGSGAEQVTSLGAQISHPQWSPDGSVIAVTSNHEGNAEIYTYSINGFGLTNLTQNPADDRWPSWSPDGTRLAFESDRDGNPEIYLLDLSDSSVIRLTQSPGADRAPVWSPDGAHIAFLSDRGGSPDVYVMETDGANVLRVSTTPGEDRDPAWSPDGRQLAYAGGLDSGATELFTVSFDGRDSRQRTSDGAQVAGPDWSPDGQWIAFASNRGGTFDLYLLDAAGEGWTALTETPQANETDPLWLRTAAAPDEEEELPSPPAATFAAEPTLLPAPTATPLPPTPAPTVSPTEAPTVTPTLPPTATIPPSLTPTLTPTPQAPDLLLVYDAAAPWFYLVNVSGQRVDLSALAFQGGGQQVTADVWLTSGFSSSLSSFAVDGCLGLWGVGVTPPPAPPECRTRHSWRESNRSLFWTDGSFTVTVDGVPVAECPSSAGRCDVVLPETITGGATPPATSVTSTSSGGDLLLIYDALAPTFDLVNVSGRRLNLSPLSFAGNGEQVNSTVWLTAEFSSRLENFAVDGCLSLWGVRIGEHPAPPECRTRHSWRQSDKVLFWTDGPFSVLYYGVTIATCDPVAGRCSVALPVEG